MSRTARNVCALGLVALTSSATAGYVGLKVGRIYATNLALSRAADTGKQLREMSRVERLLLSASEYVGVDRYYSRSGQDKWVAEFIYPLVRDGYFVDVGSADGVLHSNSKALEERGWRGICVDPFPTNMEKRTCKVFRQPVSDASGQEVDFKVAGDLGGIDRFLNRTRHWEPVRRAETVKLSTTTLDDILREAKAPRFIHYLNLDIEGAELAALQGLSLVEYEVGAWTIEHNYEEPKRRLIRELLLEKGYRLVLSWDLDDYYLSEGLALD